MVGVHEGWVPLVVSVRGWLVAWSGRVVLPLRGCGPVAAGACPTRYWVEAGTGAAAGLGLVGSAYQLGVVMQVSVVVHVRLRRRSSRTVELLQSRCLPSGRRACVVLA